MEWDRSRGSFFMGIQRQTSDVHCQLLGHYQCPWSTAMDIWCLSLPNIASLLLETERQFFFGKPPSPPQTMFPQIGEGVILPPALKESDWLSSRPKLGQFEAVNESQALGFLSRRFRRWINLVGCSLHTGTIWYGQNLMENEASVVGTQAQEAEKGTKSFWEAKFSHVWAKFTVA